MKTDAEIYADASRRRLVRRVDEMYDARSAIRLGLRKPPQPPVDPVASGPLPKPLSPLKSEAVP